MSGVNLSLSISGLMQVTFYLKNAVAGAARQIIMLTCTAWHMPGLNTMIRVYSNRILVLILVIQVEYLLSGDNHIFLNPFENSSSHSFSLKVLESMILKLLKSILCRHKEHLHTPWEYFINAGLLICNFLAEFVSVVL